MSEATWQDEYRAAMREFMAKKAEPADIDLSTVSSFDVATTYGWTDFDALQHCTSDGANCSWIVPEGATLTERTYSVFVDTLTGSNREHGVNVYPAHCACGKYEDVTLRYVGSVAEVVRFITRGDTNADVRL